MGTVVTSNQQLIAPDINDPFRNYPLYSQLGSDKIDKYLGSPTPTAYTPALQQRGGLTGLPNPNLGSTGSIEGFWFRVQNWIYVKGFFKFQGTGISPGADSGGYYTVSLPFPTIAGLDADVVTAGGACIGKGYMRDDSQVSTVWQTCTVQLLSLNHAMFILEGGNTNSRAVRFDEPWTWAANDMLGFTCMYPVVT